MKSYNKEIRRYKDENSIGLPIQLYIAQNEIIPLHRHNELEIVNALSGEVAVSINDDEVTLSPGQMLLVNSAALHSIDSTGGVCAYIVFSDRLIAAEGSLISIKYVKPFMMNTQYPYICLDKSALWHREGVLLCRRAIELLAHRITLPESCRSKFSERPSICPELEVHNCLCELWKLLYINLFADAEMRIVGNGYAVRRRTQAMTDFIRHNYRRALTLEEIAASANVSKSEASRCFQSCLNISPVNYLLRYRMEAAAQLLRNSSKSIEDISFECGFASSSYFCRMFRRHMGVTPGEYRKNTQHLT